MKNKHVSKHLKTKNHISKHRASDRSGLQIIRIACFVTIALVLCALILYLLLTYQNKKEYQQLAENLQSIYISPQYTAPTPVPTNTPEPPPGATPAPTPEPTPEPVENPVRFSYLQGINDDIVAWVVVDGTDIDYPVAYDRDGNDYYLEHNYKGEYSPSGSIYIQSYNASDFSDFNTVLYGHNMSDRSMFAQLHKFKDSDFFSENDTIIVYTPTQILTYQIFAAYRTDNKNILLRFDYTTQEDREEYIDHIYNHTITQYDYDVPVTADDRIITLSTCIGNTNYRWVVQGVLISEEATYTS